MFCSQCHPELPWSFDNLFLIQIEANFCIISFCSLLWAAGAWSMNMESSWECWMPPINGLKGFCCCNCRMYSWWGGHYSSWAVWDKRSSLAVGADLVLSCDTLTSASNGGYPKVRNHGEGPCLKCESGSSRFQPGEGPSRGPLRDYEPSDSDGAFWSTNSHWCRVLRTATLIPWSH